MCTRRSYSLALFLGILYLGSGLFANAQSVYQKSLFLDVTQLNSTLGLPNDPSLYLNRVTQDSTGISLTLNSQNESYAYAYTNNRWVNLFPSNLSYDTGIQPSHPFVNLASGSKALVVSDTNGNRGLDATYISDGVLARSVVRNADWGGLNPQTVYPLAGNFSNGTLSLAVFDDPNDFSLSLLQKQGNNPLTRLNSVPLSDPRDTRIIEEIRQIFPSARGIGVYATSAYGNTLYEYRDGGLVPVFDGVGDYFGTGEVSILNGIQHSAVPQDGYLFYYYATSYLDSGYGLYKDGTFTKIAQSGLQLPNNRGTVLYFEDAWLDGDQIVLQAVLQNPDSTIKETAILRYHNGSIEVIDRYVQSASFFGQIMLNGFVSNSFLVTEQYPQSGSVPEGWRIYRYTAVPEPGTLALVAVFGVCGIAFSSRRRRAVL